jgi:hypothetical protein
MKLIESENEKPAAVAENVSPIAKARQKRGQRDPRIIDRALDLLPTLPDDPATKVLILQTALRLVSEIYGESCED